MDDFSDRSGFYLPRSPLAQAVMDRWAAEQGDAAARRSSPPDRTKFVTDRVRPFVETPYYNGQAVSHKVAGRARVVGVSAPAGWVLVKLPDGTEEFWRTSETRTKVGV